MRKRHKRSSPGARPAMNRHRASDGCLGNRQGLHVQPGGGGRVEAALSVHTHGARLNRLRQGISQAIARVRVPGSPCPLSANVGFVLTPERSCTSGRRRWVKCSRSTGPRQLGGGQRQFSRRHRPVANFAPDSHYEAPGCPYDAHSVPANRFSPRTKYWVPCSKYRVLRATC